MKLAIARSALLLALLPTPASVAAPACGDCNQDWAVNILDALMAAQHAVGQITLTGIEHQLCDIDTSYAVDVLDALALAREAIGLSPTLECIDGWRRALVATRPSMRRDVAMAHEPISGLTVMFGGRPNSGTPFDDTWLWDGSRWQQDTRLQKPAARYGAVMVSLDDPGGSLLLFGGTGGTGLYYGDTWQWTQAGGWTELQISGPSPRTEAAMAVSNFSDSAILFGGQSAGFTRHGDTWEFHRVDPLNPTPRWEQHFPVQSPSPRAHHAMARKLGVSYEVVLFGGRDDLGHQDDTWCWDRGVGPGTVSNWVELPHSGPSERAGHSMIHDQLRNELILLGGTASLGTPHPIEDMWRWVGSGGWVQLHVVLPPGASGQGLCFDEIRDQYILFGGTTGVGASSTNFTFLYE